MAMEKKRKTISSRKKKISKVTNEIDGFSCVILIVEDF